MGRRDTPLQSTLDNSLDSFPSLWHYFRFVYLCVLSVGACVCVPVCVSFIYFSHVLIRCRLESAFVGLSSVCPLYLPFRRRILIHAQDRQLQHTYTHTHMHWEHCSPPLNKYLLLILIIFSPQFTCADASLKNVFCCFSLFFFYMLLTLQTDPPPPCHTHTVPSPPLTWKVGFELSPESRLSETSKAVILVSCCCCCCCSGVENSFYCLLW